MLRSVLVVIFISFCVSLCFADRDRETLKCFECIDCKNDTGTPSTCPKDKEVCMKIILGTHIVRRCGEEDVCGLGSVERAANKAWSAITNTFRDVSKDTELLYCCDDDYCNGAIQQLPSLLLLALPLLFAGFFNL